MSERQNCVAAYPEKYAELLGVMRAEFLKDAPPHVNEALLKNEGK